MDAQTCEWFGKWPIYVQRAALREDADLGEIRSSPWMAQAGNDIRFGDLVKAIPLRAPWTIDIDPQSLL